MAAQERVGRVGALWRFPVKSMLGEELDAVEVADGGVVGDRACAIVDVATGKVATAKHPKQWPDLLRCRAAFVEPPRAGAPLPPVRIDLADGASVLSDDPGVDRVLSRSFGRQVKLARAAPEDFTIDQLHLGEAGGDPDGPRDEVTESRLGAALFEEMGLPSPVPGGSFLDLFPVSVLSTSTLAHLGSLQAASTFDVRRFRMNVIVDTPADGFAENGWLGRGLAIGDVRLDVAMPDPRCVMTTVAQEGVDRDPEVLKALARHNRLDVGGGRRYPCAGVYAVVGSPGTLTAGDPVTLD